MRMAAEVREEVRAVDVLYLDGDRWLKLSWDGEGTFAVLLNIGIATSRVIRVGVGHGQQVRERRWSKGGKGGLKVVGGSKASVRMKRRKEESVMK